MVELSVSRSLDFKQGAFKMLSIMIIMILLINSDSSV